MEAIWREAANPCRAGESFRCRWRVAAADGDNGPLALGKRTWRHESCGPAAEECTAIIAVEPPSPARKSDVAFYLSSQRTCRSPSFSTAEPAHSGVAFGPPR